MPSTEAGKHSRPSPHVLFGRRPAPRTRKRLRTAGLVGAPVLVSALAALTLAFNVGSVASAGTDCPIPVPMKVPPTTVVVGKGDPADCTEATLRAAVLAGGRITFDCGPKPVTIPVAQELKVGKDVQLDGGGKVTLKGGGSNRILVPQSGTHLSVHNLGLLGGAAKKVTATDQGDRLNGGAISGGWRTYVEVVNSTFENNTAHALGGAIYVGTDSTLSIVNSVFTGNSAASGGAVRGMLSPISIINSTLNGNTSSGGGGALETDGVSAPDKRDGELLICGSTISHNKSQHDGGGAFIWTYIPERITIRKTTFEGNISAGSWAGAARFSTGPNDEGGDGTGRTEPSLTIDQSSFLSNSAATDGGALWLTCIPFCTISDTTFHGNTAKNNGGAVFGGGNITNRNVTYAGNQAGYLGGALFGGNTTLHNSVLAGNSAKNQWGFAQNCHSTGTGSNVMQWPTPRPGGDSPCIKGAVGADPRLGAPADNGGPTLTLLPAADSPALKAGTDCTPIDQRGMARDTEVCDLGALQRSGVAAPTSVPPPPPSPTIETSPSASIAPSTSTAPSTGAGPSVPATVSVAPPALSAEPVPSVPPSVPPAPSAAPLARPSAAPVANVPPTPPKGVVVIGGQSGRCLDVPNFTTVNGSQTQLSDCSGQRNQSWTRTATKQITVYGNKCLTALGRGNGTPAVIADCTGQPNQQWNVNADGSITGVASGMCLDAYGARTARGTKIILWPCHGQANQRWLLRA